MDYTVHGILQARILEWVAFPFSRAPSQPRDQTQVSRTAGGFFTSWAIREALSPSQRVKIASIRLLSYSAPPAKCLSPFCAILLEPTVEDPVKQHGGEKNGLAQAWTHLGDWMCPWICMSRNLSVSSEMKRLWVRFTSPMLTLTAAPPRLLESHQSFSWHCGGVLC